MNSIVLGVAKSCTQLSDFHFTYNIQQFASANPKLPCGAAKEKGGGESNKIKAQNMTYVDICGESESLDYI